MSEQQENKKLDIREALTEAVKHLEHILPGQAPIKDFVHHNTLHGFQHLPFPQALEQAWNITGNFGYLSQEQFRQYYARGRINDEDLEVVLLEDNELEADQTIASFESRSIRRLDIYKARLLYSLTPITNTQLNWQIAEWNSLGQFQPDVKEENRCRLLESAQSNNEIEIITDLWTACLEALGLQHYILHPEELLDLGQEDAERIFSQLTAATELDSSGKPMVHRLVRKEAERTLQQLADKVGPELTLSGFLHNITGTNLVDEVRPILIRHISAFLDHGLAAWHNADRSQGFYFAWRSSAMHDLAWAFDDMEDAVDELRILSENPLETVVGELQRLGLPRGRWVAYIERLALELPGWSGMFLWRHNHPGYENMIPEKVEMMDYLAVRLVLERLTAQRLCRKHWQIEPRLDVLQAHFRRHRSEFIVRYLLYNGRLPEYILNLAQRLASRRAPYRTIYAEWISLADRIWTWRHSPAADRPIGYSVYRSGWRLFRLAQHLGLCGEQIRSLEKTQIDEFFSCIDRLDDNLSGYLWLQAYERNYREQLLNTLANNHGRGAWNTRQSRPDAQVVFCMDDREESIRRHLEELNPNIETMGAAGFFGVAINWRGLDDSKVTPLCPVVVKPAHEVREVPQPGAETYKAIHDKRREYRMLAKYVLHQETRRNLVSSSLIVAALAPLYLLVLAAKLMAPRLLGGLTKGLRRQWELRIKTFVAVVAAEENTPATPEQPRLGFTNVEQADRVEKFLRAIGLTSGFAPFVVMMGHGSNSQNNPHLAAYDCGACSGRHGGPNARVFAAMANRPVIRELLRRRGIEIPENTWFMGAEHNTCNDGVTWYDSDIIPAELQEPFAQLQNNLDHAREMSAHERCRRLASAPKAPTPQQALKHIIGRSHDFSQARPELGHATNAAAFIGRRAMSQGAFLDRRVFLISYDPSQDPSGKILEAILLAAGPVGAGINLEYYFSTVNNDRYGCSSKIMHNLIGSFGVMEGTSSDLRTGLPKQMIEIHEAMRLQIIVEASTEVLTTIYQQQPVLQELIGNLWVHLIAKDPYSNTISLFKPGEGFVPWEGKVTELPTVKQSAEWYKGHGGALPFALIEKKAVQG